MERQPRKRYSGEQIIGILKRHLVEGVPVSDVCEEAGIHPTQFYRWQKQLFEVGASVFDRKPGRAESREVKASMTEREVELVLQRAREKYQHDYPRIISDNGPQFIARDFKEFIREVGLTHVRISPGYPQANGKLGRYHRNLKEEGIRPRAPGTE